jgi:hypothetical protein
MEGLGSLDRTARRGLGGRIVGEDKAEMMAMGEEGEMREIIGECETIRRSGQER